ncbi:MAG: Rieske (2Fe-2S) protein [Candidatus Omnitrophica bacterium]|nr:Rieske (2Fe-2S) protein [Candidatus Omnitrophota bacterium]
MTRSWHSLAKVSDFNSAKSKYVDLGNKEIALFFVEGKFHATDNFCPHRGGPLFRGNIEPGPNIRCPLHGWNFDMKSGQSLNMPQATITTYPVEIRGEEVFVHI